MAIPFLILIALAFLAFFSGMGVAYNSTNKISLEVEMQKGTFTSTLLTVFTSNQEQYHATMKIGYLISMVMFGVFFSIQSAQYLIQLFHHEWIVLIIQVIIPALFILIFIDFISKTVFKINATGYLKIFSVPILFCYLIFYPIALLLLFLSKCILWCFTRKKNNQENDKNVFLQLDLDNYSNPSQIVGENESEQEETEVELFRNALDFSKVRVRDCIVPRTELVAVEDTSSIDELKLKFTETGYSKILVYNENIDNIVGYVHSSQMFKNPTEIKSVLNPVSFVPETMMASNLLSAFTQKHKSIAIVVDEFGGTSGMITTEDVLEEIFGEIEDEHDTDDLIIKKIKDHEWILSARHEISLLNGKYHFNFPEDDEYDTIAGLILNHHENIPKKNSIITIGSYEFRILKVTETRIELVLMKILTTN